MTRPRDEEPADRFWAKVTFPPNIISDCWLWQGGKLPFGHGRWLERKGKAWMAHRYAFEAMVGPIGDSCVCHRCDNPACVNPAHLFLGTRSDNHADMVAKGRNAKGDTHGSHIHQARRPRGSKNPAAKLTEEQVREIRAAIAAGEQQRPVAARYGVSQPLIGMIARREWWRHVT